MLSNPVWSNQGFCASPLATPAPTGGSPRLWRMPPCGWQRTTMEAVSTLLGLTDPNCRVRPRKTGRPIALPIKVQHDHAFGTRDGSQC
jgi:hypothetical protein